MSYDKRFNNTLAIWAAFGGRGEIEFIIPSLSWRRVGYSHFGYSSVGGETKIDVYDNGINQIAVYYAKAPYMAYFNKTTKKWTLSNVSWWNHGAPDILYAADGVFIAKIVGLANIIASFDGITWHNAGYCTGAKNHMECGAYDMNRGSGVVSFWYYKTPIYSSFDSLTQRTAWTLRGSDGESVPIFKYLTTHKGYFVGVVGGGKSIARASSSSPGSWGTTIAEDTRETKYMYIRSVKDVLFVLKYRYKDGIYYVNLCVMNDSATGIIETNLSLVGDLTDNRIASPQNIIWMEDWGKFAVFTEEMLYVSNDGIYWEGKKQTGLTTRDLVTFGGAIYVPGDGFYLSTNDGYTYHAEY